MSFPKKYCISENNFSVRRTKLSDPVIQKYKAAWKFFSSRRGLLSSQRGLLSSRRGLSSSRRGLLNPRRELKNWIQEQLVWFTYF